ncbi:MAG: M10 family metallopeptidase C-terminal domain-containing protein, partial [Pseudolabrys sp.]
TFAEDNFGTLVLDNPTAYTGQIFGFGGASPQSSDAIDLKGITFDAGTSWTYFDNAGSDTGGSLTIYEAINGATTALDTLTFANGDYTTANFILTSDGNGGTLIADPPPDSGTVTIAAHDSFIFIGSANADTLIGGPQNDTFIGGGGGDTMKGGGGSDAFVFKTVTDSQPGTGHFDTITDFTAGTDRIDLSAIVGASNVQGQVGMANTVAANSISWFADNAHNETVLYVNTTAAANHVDMEIHLTGTNINLTGSDILHHA